MVRPVSERLPLTPPAGNIPIWATGATQTLVQAFQEHGYRLNRVFPKDGSESLTAVAADPDAIADEGFLYVKLVSTKPELFYKGEDGAIQLTSVGSLNTSALSSNVALLDRDPQTFTGRQRFAEGANLATLVNSSADADERVWGFVVDSTDGDFRIVSRPDSSETSGGSIAIEINRSGTDIADIQLHNSLGHNYSFSGGNAGISITRSIIDLNPTPDSGSGDAFVRVARTSDTTGRCGIILLRANSTAPAVFLLHEGGNDRSGIDIRQSDAAPATTSVRGMIWVRDDTPNTLMFTDGAGNDFTVDVTAA